MYENNNYNDDNDVFDDVGCWFHWVAIVIVCICSYDRATS